MDPLDAAGALHFAQPADTAADGCSAAELNAFFLRQRQQLVIEGGNQCLVGGNHVLTGLNGSTHKFVSRVQTTHSFNDGIDGVILQHPFEVPGHFRVGQKDIFQADDLCHLHIIAFCGNIINAATHDAKAQ